MNHTQLSSSLELQRSRRLACPPPDTTESSLVFSRKESGRCTYFLNRDPIWSESWASLFDADEKNTQGVLHQLAEIAELSMLDKASINCRSTQTKPDMRGWGKCIKMQNYKNCRFLFLYIKYIYIIVYSTTNLECRPISQNWICFERMLCYKRHGDD